VVKVNKKLIVNALVLLVLFISMVKANSAEEDARAWLNMQATGKTGIENVRWYMEIQPRVRDDFKERDQSLVRPALIYDIAPKTSLWFGYVYVRTYTDNPLIEKEHRYWQQILHEFEPINGIRLRAFTRLEQRTFEGTSDIGHKIRQRVTLNFPFKNNPNLSTLIFDEYHHNLNSTDFGARRGFDQNRLFAGFAYKISPKSLVEIGYLNQYVNRKNEDAMNHVFSTTFYYNF
jgi:hypothetical protein